MLFKRRPGINQQTKKRHLVVDVVLLFLFVGSAIGIVVGIYIYRDTIIANRSLALPAIMGTIGALPVLFYFTKHFLKPIYMFFLAATIGGGNSYFLTLYLNKQMAAPETNTAMFEIKKTGNLAKGRRGKCNLPYIMIDFNGLEKQLIFNCWYEHRIKTYKIVKLVYVEGYFGYPVIVSRSLPDY